jgi:Mg/Co/Ni transporter MgtE
MKTREVDNGERNYVPRWAMWVGYWIGVFAGLLIGLLAWFFFGGQA